MKKWITVPVTALAGLDYNNLLVTSADTAPRNIAGDTALIKWRGDMPSDVAAVSGKGTELDHAGAKTLLSSDDWREEVPE